MFQEVQREGDKRVPYGGGVHMVDWSMAPYGVHTLTWSFLQLLYCVPYLNAEFSPTFRTRKGDDYDGPLEDVGFEMLHPACPNLRTQLFVFWLTQ